jgi:hypothetical protein
VEAPRVAEQIDHEEHFGALTGDFDHDLAPTALQLGAGLGLEAHCGLASSQPALGSDVKTQGGDPAAVPLGLNLA